VRVCVCVCARACVFVETGFYYRKEKRTGEDIFAYES